MSAWPGREVTRQSAPQPVFTAPGDPLRAAGDARDEVRTGIAVSGEERAGRTEERQIGQEQFGNIDTLRQRYDQQQPVKEYRAVLPLLMTGLQAPADATGDNTLLYAYARVMDPGSVVRESEMGMAASGASVFDEKVAALKKQFGIEGGGNLPEDVRLRLKRDMNTKLAEMGRSYLLQRQRFGQDAEAAGLDPVRVLGPHDSEPFRERYYSLMEELGIDVKRPGEEAAPTGGGGEAAQSPWPGVIDQQGNPLGPEGGYGFDPVKNEWGMYSRVSDDSPSPYDPGSERDPNRRVTGNDPGHMQIAAGVGDIAQAVGDIVGLAGNPLNQTINWLTGSDLSTDLGETLRTDVLGLPHGDPTIETINRATTGGFIPAAGAARVAQVANPGLWRSALAELGAAPMRDAVTGAAAGAAGEGAKAMGGGPVAQTVATLAGGAAGAGAASRIPRTALDTPIIAPQPARTAPLPAQRYAAGQEYGLDMSVGDAGRMGSRLIERSLDAQPASATVMDASRQNLAREIDTAVGDVANTYGTETSFRGMGEAAQRGARGWMDRFAETTGRLYEAIPIKPETQVALDNTRGALRDLTENFASNPQMREAMQNSRLVQLRDALEGGLSWQDLKAFRTDIGEQIGEALLTDGTRKGQLRRLYAALSQDMELTAQQVGPRALRAFRRANDTTAAGHERIEGAIRSLIGNNQDASPEAAAAFLQRIAREGRGSSDLKALADVRRTLRPEEWSQVSNAFIRLMGQPANSAGREFAPQTFVRVYDDMADEAKNLLFGGQNKELRQNLDKFVGVIRDLAENDATRNVSRTALGLGGTISTSAGGAIGGIMGNAVGGPVGGLLGIMLGIAGTHATNYQAAKLWTNPGFVRWATGYTKMLKGAAANGGQINPKAHESQMRALVRLATSNTIIAGEARDLQRQLLAQFEQGALPLAAQEEPQSADSRETAGAAQ